MTTLLGDNYLDIHRHWLTKRRHVYYETSRRAGLEFVCVFGHDGIAYNPAMRSLLKIALGIAALVLIQA